MNRYGIYEAQRLLRRASEINPEAATMAVKAMQNLADAHIIPVHALYYIYQSFSEQEQNHDRIRKGFKS